MAREGSLSRRSSRDKNSKVKKENLPPRRFLFLIFKWGWCVQKAFHCRTEPRKQDKQQENRICKGLITAENGYHQKKERTSVLVLNCLQKKAKIKTFLSFLFHKEMTRSLCLSNTTSLWTHSSFGHKSWLLLRYGIFSQNILKKLFCGTLLLWWKCLLQVWIEILLPFLP